MSAYWANFANDFLGERSKLAPISSSFSSLNKWRFLYSLLQYRTHSFELINQIMQEYQNQSAGIL
jgi:hypothetical protein